MTRRTALFRLAGALVAAAAGVVLVQAAAARTARVVALRDAEPWYREPPEYSGEAPYELVPPEEGSLRSGLYIRRRAAACRARRQALAEWAWWQEENTFRGPLGAPLVRFFLGGEVCLEEHRFFDWAWLGLADPEPNPGWLGERPSAASPELATVGVELGAVAADSNLRDWTVRWLSWSPWGSGAVAIVVEGALVDSGAEVVIGGAGLPTWVAAHWHGEAACEQAKSRWVPSHPSATGEWRGADRTALRWDLVPLEAGHRPAESVDVLLMRRHGAPVEPPPPPSPACTLTWWQW